MQISDKLKNFIEEHINLIEGQEYSQLFMYSGDQTLELIQLLKKVDNTDKLENYLITSSDEHFIKNILSSFLVISGEDTTGYFGERKTAVSDKGFRLFSQVADFDCDFTPNTRCWHITSTYEGGPDDSGSYQILGYGFDNLVHNMWNHQYQISWFGGEDWDPADCYIGDSSIHPIKNEQIVYD